MSQHHSHTPTESETVGAGRSSPAWPFIVGIPLLLIALFLQTVTLASQSYRSTLISALVFTALADLCFIYSFRRGGIFARILSIVYLLPTLFVISDFLRRTS